MSVKLKEVSKSFGRQKVLDRISFNVNSGEIVGILGPNGAGKSTMMKIITGFQNQDEGSVWINNKLNAIHFAETRHLIGYLPENNPLYGDLYVREYLEFMSGLYAIENIKTKVLEITELTGLTKERHKKIGALSKGYRQRVGIAQAIIHNPPILVLDEPTSGLDPSQIVEIRQLIRQISRNKTVLMSTHIMQEAEAVCDRIIIMNDGKIIADDTTSNIKSITMLKQFTVEFAEKADLKKLSEIPGVIGVNPLDANKFIIKSENKDLRPDLFHFAVDNKLTLLTLNEQESTLEHVFLELIG